jgi:hypothetical protein
MTETARHLRLRRTAFAAVAATVLILLSSCSSSGDSDDTSTDADVSTSSRDVGSAPESESESEPDADQAADVGAEGSSPESAGTNAGTEVAAEKVISTGNVQLRSDDVGRAIFDVRKVVDVHAGTVSEDDTETDPDGAALRSRMVLRIPTAEFDDAMTELEKIGTLVSSKRSSADVTTQVLDLDVRVEAQQRSIDRVQVLFDNASTLKDIFSIEGELSRRQSDLASLQAQQRYLQDQTSMSTITLAIERTPEPPKPAPKPKPEPETDDDTGFMAGLSGGWNALHGFLVGLATVAGALLPWMVLLLVLAIPGWPVYRRLRRREASPA